MKSADDEPDHRPRPTGLRGAGLALAGGRMVAAACGLVQVPVVFGALDDTAAFGVWVILTALVWTVGTCDGGLGSALQNRIAAALARGRSDEAAGWIQAGARWLGALALVYGGLGGLTIVLLPWRSFADAPGTVPAAWLALAAAVAALPLNLAPRVALASGRAGLNGLWTALAAALSLAGVLAVAQVAPGLPGLVAAASSLPVLLGAGVAGHLWFRTPWLRRSAGPRPPAGAAFGREVLGFLSPQLTSLLTAYLLPVLVGLTSGAAAVAAFALLQRLYGLVQQLHGLALYPLWPAYTRAAAQGDAAFARRTFRRSVLITLATVVALLVATPLVPEVLRRWVGAGAPTTPPLLLWSVALLQGTLCLLQPPLMLLNGLTRLRPVATMMWIQLIVALALSLAWGGHGSGAGVALAFALPALVLVLPVLLHASARGLRELPAASPPLS